MKFRGLIPGLAALALALTLASAAPPAVIPTAPAGVTGIALSARVDLAWQAVPGVDAYTVYRGTAPTSVTTRLTSATGIIPVTFSDTTAVNGTTYYYAVRSVSGGVESPSSLIVQAKPVSRACSTGNAVVLENCFPGNAGWKVVNPGPIGQGGIEGFATAQSVNRGDSVDLKVNADDGATFRVEVYRTGYYGGAGARLFSVIRDVPAVRQPGCQTTASTGLIDCSNWSISTTLSTTASWPTGVYLLRLVRTDTNTDFHILLVVRDDSRSADLMYGVSFSSFEAYNNYGGKSLYDFNSTGANTVGNSPRAVKVSFDRPFEQSRSGQRDWYPKDEFATVYWLEQSGYDTQYISNTDLEGRPSLALGHKAYISPAHDEYWSGGMRSAVTAARDAGINLFFSGSNEVYWKVRFENGPTGGSNRVEVCYKTVQAGAADPVTPTTTWRDPAGPNQPENALAGQMYIGDNDSTYFPLVVTAAEGGDRVYRYTGLDAQPPGTSTTLGSSLVGWEWDAPFSNGFGPSGLKVLAGSPVAGGLIQNNGAFTSAGSTTATMTKYTAPSGALVVSTGTNHWNRGLALNVDGAGEPVVTIQQVTTNILADMGAQPATPAGNIVLDVAANRPAAPTGLAATGAGVDQISVSWNPVPGAAGYNVYRSTVSRDSGLPLGALANGTLVTGTTFADVGLNSATAYYYIVTAVVNGIQSLSSNEASAITAASAGQPTRIDAGGTADYISGTGATFRADAFFTGGLTNRSTHTISGTADPALYQSERYGAFTYSIPVASGTYDVRLHFVELYYGTVVAGGAGKRVFSIDVGNTAASPDLPNIDVFATVGANTALVRTVSGVTVTNGVLDVHSVYGSADDPEVAAIEVIPRSIPPSVVDTTPAAGATGIGRLSRPLAVFSRAMDATTISGSTVTLSRGTTQIAGTVSYDAAAKTATFSPTGSLDYDTTYTARLTTGIKADDGTPLAAPVTWSFTTLSPLPLTVTTSFPANGASGVTTTVVPTATFSRSVDPSTITSSSFTLKNGSGTVVPANVGYTEDTRTATLTPLAGLSTSQTYTATMTTAVKAVDGVALASPVVVTFTTAASTPPPPTVTARSPGDGASGVAIAAPVTATFSRAMHGGSLTASSFSLAGPSGTLAATVTYDAATQTATLVPAAQLLPGTVFTARLEIAVHALDGSALLAPVTWSFTTTPPPTIVSRSPAAGAGYTARATTVSATFSRAMDPTTVTATSFVVTGPTGAVPATVAYDSASKTATLTPTSMLSGNTSYTAGLAPTVSASDGTPLTAAVSWSFTTAGCPCTLLSPLVVPAATGLATQDGRTGAGPFTYEFGVKVVVDEPMRVTAIRFYKSPGETGTHVGNIWSVGTGEGGPTGAVQIWSQTFTNETASGWQQQALSSPLTIQPGITFVVSVNANSKFVTTGGGLRTQILSGPMRSVADGVDGVFAFAAGQYPTQSYNSTNYFVDLEAVPSPDPAPPTVAAVSPVSGALAVDRAAPVVGSFSRSMDPTTITSSTVTLTTGGGTPIPATVSYDDSTRRFTLTPSAQLAYTTTYTVHVSTGALARDGMSLAPSSGWSFTTADPVPVQVTDSVPAAGASDVGGTVHPRAVFSKVLKASTVNGTTFTLSGPSGSVAGTVSYDAATLQATFTPTAVLPSGSYTARLDASITATDDATLAAPYTWSFTVPGALAPPAVTTTTPANGATGQLRSTAVTAAFSRSMDPATLTSSTFTLTGPSGAVPTTVTYDGAARVATLTPVSVLVSNTTYTATVTTGVKSVDGTAVTAPTSWSFTTAACPCTLFSPVLTPALTGLSTQDGRSGAGPWTYELGVKITVTQTMQLAAIRFFKDAGETGTHVGRIWTASGAQIANVTFTNESASGWQQQALSSPILLQANAVYVVSINANSRFVVTGGGLQTQIVNGPLRSVADGTNGMYALAANSFPNLSYNSSNYFVDAVVQPDSIAPPTVIAATPASGATSVPRTSAATATFSRSMDATSLTAGTFTMTGPGGAVAGTVTYDDSTKTARFVPSSPLAYSTTYSARVSASVRAADGVTLSAPVQWSFTVAAPVPPTVTSVIPTNGSLDVSGNVVLRATFSKPIDPSTISAGTFTLNRAGGPVAGTVAYDAATQTASFTPTASLGAGTYTAALGASITSADSVLLGTTYTWSFTVPAAAPPAPAIISTAPVGGATGVDRAVHVQATFNRDLAPATVNSSTFDLRAAGGSIVAATVSYDSSTRTSTLVPSTLLAASAVYTVEVGSGMQAADGTAMTPSSWTFTTAACPCSLFASTAAPSSTGNSTQDGRSGSGPFTYELGVKVAVDSPLQLSAVRFYKDPLETGTHVASVWAANGTLLATVTFTGESGSGWQQQALATPLSLQPGVTYVVSVGYNAAFGLTGGGLASQVTSGPLHSIADGANGVYATTAGQFPTSSWNSGNYFVDVVVR